MLAALTTGVGRTLAVFRKISAAATMLIRAFRFPAHVLLVRVVLVALLASFYVLFVGTTSFHVLSPLGL
jgi:hypothetical protein